MALQAKTKKKHKKNKLKIDVTNWNTTDADEITRRKIRAELEKFNIKKIEVSPYFGAYHVSSQNNKKYTIEIRSLHQHYNSCDCPDYRSNGLGTCKHIEGVLQLLKKKGVRKFKNASTTGSDRVEIFLDPINKPTVRVIWPQKIFSSIRKIIEPFFSSEGSLLGETTITFDKLKTEVSKNKNIGPTIRISNHIQYFIDYQKINLQKQIDKNNFMEDVALKKRTLNLVKFPLFPYQQEGMLHLAFTERALLADEMGLGKTVQAVAACELLRQLRNVQRVLIVTTASLKAEWEEQIAKFTDLSSLIVFGSRPARLKQYQKNSFFYLMNYEQVISDHAEIQRLLAPDVVILDEAQRIKNWQTKTANAVKELKSRYAFVLTGTPVENRIDDIYSIVQFLDPRLFGPLFRFNRDFYDLDENGRPIGYKNLDELYRRLRPIMLCRKKLDVEDELPKRLNNNFFVQMESEQRIRYEEYEAKVARLVQRSKHRSLRKEEFEMLQRWLACMRMICDTPYILDKNCRISPKLQELAEILKELLEDPTTKIIIFSEWERMLFLVKEMAEENDWGIAWHTGSVPQHKRRENINRFKNDSHCQLFLSTDAGSVGLNLQAANVVINLDLPWNPAKLEQRIARAWRKHQTRPVQVINLICENSIEHRMLYLLEQKQLLAQSVLTGDAELKAMKMPSGRTAFMERIEALVDKPTLHPENKLGITEDVSANNLEPHSNEKSNLNLNLENRKNTLETIDPKTLEAIQQLIDAGILTCNIPSLLKPKPKTLTPRLEEAKNYLAQAEHKEKLTRLLVAGDFLEEAIPTLQETYTLSLHAFTSLIGENQNLAKEKLSNHFVQEILINQHGLPKHAASLFSQLVESSTTPQNIKALCLDQQKMTLYIKNAIGNLSMNLEKEAVF